jgi:hypothetical protein
MYQIPLETFVRETLNKRSWVFGDQLVGKFAQRFEINVAWEVMNVERDGIPGFEATCSALRLDESGWYGSKEGARRIAAWKWLKRAFVASGANVDLYYRLVKKFAREVIDVGTKCRLCDEDFQVEVLWEHLEECTAERRRLQQHEQERVTIPCAICDERLTLVNYEVHIARCRLKMCDECGEEIRKVDEARHLEICRPAIIHQATCPFCDEAMDAEELHEHVGLCAARAPVQVPERICKICGDCKIVRSIRSVRTC